jgi:hypothetical protein
MFSWPCGRILIKMKEQVRESDDVQSIAVFSHHLHPIRLLRRTRRCGTPFMTRALDLVQGGCSCGESSVRWEIAVANAWS